MAISSKRAVARPAKPAILLLALSLLSSCAGSAVTGFAWKDSSGKAIEFAQSSSWPAGEEGRFGGGRKANRYIPTHPISLSEGEAIQVHVLRGAARGGGGKAATIKLSLSAKPDGSAPIAEASFPLLEEEARLVLPSGEPRRVASLVVEAVGEETEFGLESVGTVPAFKGIEDGKDSLRVSSDFSLALAAGRSELSIDEPFAGIDAKGGGTDSAAILLEYGKPTGPGILRLDILMRDGSSRKYKLRSHPAGVRTVLGRETVPSGTARLTLHVPEGIDVSSFYATKIERADFELADLGRVIRDVGDIDDFALYRWDMLPTVLVFDFRDYATQDRYLKRLAFFVEKAGYRGILAKDEDIASLHGWNAHDYRAEDLAAFFRAAEEKGFPLGPEERRLEDLLVEAGTIRRSGGKLEAGAGAIISISRESSDYLRWTFAVHESTHAIFFADREYRDFVRSLWGSVGPEEKWFWKTYLGWAAYDVRSDYLMGNEFQAYLLQQPKEKAEEYFSKRKADELLEKHEELRPRIEEYMKKFGKSFKARAGQLEAWLYGKYGVEAGRTIFLAPES